MDITTKEIFKELKDAAEKSIKDNNDIIPYMSGTTMIIDSNGTTEVHDDIIIDAVNASIAK